MEGSGISSDGWVLTPEEEKIAIATARLHKIKRLEWLGRRYHKEVTEEEAALTEEEEAKALIVANRLKFTKMELERMRDENRARRVKEYQELKDMWNYGYFYKQLKDRAYQAGEELIYNESTAPIIKAICFRLSGDSRYETEMGFSFRKGLIIRGEPGLGKSWVISMLAENPVCPVQIILMKNVARAIRKNGEFTGVNFADFRLIHLADVGAEVADVKNYGNEINWFSDFLETTYDLAKPQLSRLLITTNCSAQEFEERYGRRTRDRLKEFDLLDLDGKSLRGK
jgi:hypothetical protein